MYFLIPYTAPTDRIIFYDCVEQYPFVAKASYDSFYLTPPLLLCQSANWTDRETEERAIRIEKERKKVDIVNPRSSARAIKEYPLVK